MKISIFPGFPPVLTVLFHFPMYSSFRETGTEEEIRQAKRLSCGRTGLKTK